MRRLPVLFAFLGLFVSAAPPARPDLASMVADLDVRVGPNYSSDPQSFVRVGSRVVFFADAPPGERGRVLPWASDGTPAGTVRIPGDPLIQGVGTVGGAYLWFGSSLRGDSLVNTLWRSDGTAAGTAQIAEGAADEYLPGALEAARFYFFRRVDALELWESDGSAAGTRKITSLPQAGEVHAAAARAGQVFFVTADHVSCGPGCEGSYENMAVWRTRRSSGQTRRLHWSHQAGRFELYATAGGLVFFPGDGRLWATDGTVRGTAPVGGKEDLLVGRIAGTVAGKLYFSGRDPRHGEGLWTSDGTEPGTRLLARGLETYWHRDDPMDVGGRYFFVASDAAHGTELWSTRGTPATTALVADLCPGPCSALAPGGPSLTAAGERVFLFADDGVHGTDLWVTDGTRAGTRRIFALGLGEQDGVPRMRAEGNEVFFYRRRGAGNVELWASDGTQAGTRRLMDFATLPDPSTAPRLARLGSRIVTVGYDPRGGFEPWTLDPHGRGGRPLGDLNSTEQEGGAYPFDAVALGDRLLFMTQRDGSLVAWSTRGSAETTVELAAGSTGPTLPRTAVVGDVAYLNLTDLWASDGTPAATVRLTDFASAAGGFVSTAAVDLGGRAVFGVTFVGSWVTELWTSDGTARGTHRAGPTSSPLPSFPGSINNLTAAGGGLYFLAFDDLSRTFQVWTADSTLASVRRLTDLEPNGISHLAWPGFVPVGPHVYFVSGQGSLWRTDGRPEGTRRVPAPAVSGVGQSERTVFGFQESVLLFTAPPVSSSEPYVDHLRLWAGDGSGADWVEVRDFGAGSSLLEVVSRTEDVLLLVWDGRNERGGGGARLYRTDGTAAGTATALDFEGLGVGTVDSLAAVGDRLFFAAGPKSGSTEPWTSGGTRATTRRLQEIVPGPGGSEPRGFTVAGSRLYFSADDAVHGRELWSLPLDELDAPCRPSGKALCLGDGRFRAELFWHDRQGRRGDGGAVPWSSTSGSFWYYGYDNPEAVVKMVDAGAVNGSHRLFFGPLGEAHVALTVTDLETGDCRRYPADPGPLPAFADLAAFPSARAAAPGDPEPESSGGPATWPAAAELTAGTAGPCLPAATRLCLHGGRFAVDLAFQEASGAERQALAFAHGDRAGYFAFYGPRHVHAALKILDRRAVNGRFWLFATSLTHGGYTLRVTDTATGTVYRYPKPAGETSSVIDRWSLR